jgi:hypothetical protein
MIDTISQNSKIVNRWIDSIRNKASPKSGRNSKNALLKNTDLFTVLVDGFMLSGECVADRSMEVFMINYRCYQLKINFNRRIG